MKEDKDLEFLAFCKNEELTNPSGLLNYRQGWKKAVIWRI